MICINENNNAGKRKNNLLFRKIMSEMSTTPAKLENKNELKRKQINVK